MESPRMEWPRAPHIELLRAPRLEWPRMESPRGPHIELLRGPLIEFPHTPESIRAVRWPDAFSCLGV
jgi:hypothetical protein